MALTPDLLSDAIGCLESGSLPDADALRTLIDVLRRCENGMPYEQATARTGPLKLAERDDAIRRAAQDIALPDADLWNTAGRLKLRLQLANGPEALRDARKAGAGKLSRRSLWNLLKNDSG